jgi:hypothetical protein
MATATNRADHKTCHVPVVLALLLPFPGLTLSCCCGGRVGTFGRFASHVELLHQRLAVPLELRLKGLEGDLQFLRAEDLGPTAWRCACPPRERGRGLSRSAGWAVGRFPRGSLLGPSITAGNGFMVEFGGLRRWAQSEKETRQGTIQGFPRGDGYYGLFIRGER